MALDVATFRARYPEFTDPPYTDAMILLLLEDAQCDVSRAKFSDSECGQRIYDRIVCALAAHYLAIKNNAKQGNQAGIGPASSVTVGRVSASFKTSSASSTTSEYFSATVYGQEYLQLLARYCSAMTTVC